MTETLGLYIQTPFCASKCSFCNFSSRVAPAAVYKGYSEAVAREAALIAESAPEAGPRLGIAHLPVDTVYFGGGTPTLLGEQNLDCIFRALHQNFSLARAAEITIEMTPGSASPGLLNGLRRLHVNRLSVGAQSFSDDELRPTGRLHSAAETVAQVAAARKAGFRNISLDLIAGLPRQTIESWRRSLEALARLEPEHASIYLFEVDENSRLGRDALRAAWTPDEDFMAQAYEISCEFLAGEGYEHYEISNFARPGFESIHNRRYWRRQPYLGLGAGAHSFDGAGRWANESSPAAYQARLERGELPVTEKRDLDPTAEMEEYFFLGLRERRGVSLEDAWRRWGAPPLNVWMEKASRLQREGFLQTGDDRLSLTDRAYLVSNEIFQEFLI